MTERFPRVLWSSLAISLLLITPLAAEDNPAAAGFNLDGSDAKAIGLADRAMESMGGRGAWDDTRYLAWRFFGNRDHVWDKWTGDIRITTGDTVVLMNIHSKDGRAWKAGEALTGDALAEQLDGGYKAWVNDSYWLVMPYKLKDSGVTLRYVGEGAMEDGRAADIVQMTFEDVGVTPQNKYHVWLARDTGLVEQWAYFPTADLEEPGFVTPWADWQQYGRVKLSSSRGDGRFANAIAEIRVYDELPRSVFESPDPPRFP